MKKILLNEAEKKALILEREKAIVKSFAKTFNTIKRIDENEINENLIPFEIPSWAVTSLINGDDSGLEVEDIAKIDNFVNKVAAKFGNAHFILGDVDGEDDLGFRHSNSIDNLGSDVIRLYILPTNKIKENDGEDYEAASRGIEYGINPYQDQTEIGDEKQKFDFIKSAIESASGDKVEKRDFDDYGRDIYWSLNNNNVTYFIGGDNEDDIIIYNGETGERYPIGNLKQYDEPRKAKDDPNNSLY